jgi:hypothetical protein
MASRRAVAPVPALAPPRSRSFSHGLADGARTTVHAAAYPLARWRPRIVALDPPQPLAAWCAANGTGEGLVGGFFLRPDGRPLGEVWTGGRRVPSVPFLAPWARRRSCVAIAPAGAAIAPRDRLPARPAGDLLQAGPLLVACGRVLVRDGGDPEGFSSGREQFDSDITVGRYPRAALGLAGRTLLAVVCDGRSDSDAGLTLAELARLMTTLGATDAINLDGGGSTSLVSGGRLLNTPREEHGIELLGGRPVSTAVVFEPRS